MSSAILSPRELQGTGVKTLGSTAREYQGITPHRQQQGQQCPCYTNSGHREEGCIGSVVESVKVKSKRK